MFREIEPPIELWGGVECTVNRVGGRYFNQLELNGHARRIEDLDRFADLGIRAFRQPVLWELLEPERDSEIDWSWTDQRLERLRSLNIRPIAGLVHHGSGPLYTNLLDPEFITGLARFAARVADRYPWIEDYTPVNEPMTTARFSGLYGSWYPHHHSHESFLRMLVVQCRAVAEAMSAIRKVNPRARLVQTEDFGRTYASPSIQPLAGDLNERRWLTLDLLCGTLKRESPIWGYFLRNGVTEDELKWFHDHPSPPDLIGVNHYLTSDRFLDDSLHLYPAEIHASAGPFHFVDVEAVRACADCPITAGGVLRDAWERFKIPVAITEAHLGCTREEQMRWLQEVASDAAAERSEGVDVRAVTVWSLLGAYNWNTMVTRESGHYEPGVFDLRSPQPRPTALAGLVRTLAGRNGAPHPVLGGPGWWHRPERVLHAKRRPPALGAHPSGRELLILGASGALGTALVRMCEMRGIAYRVCRAADGRAAIEQSRPWAVVNAAGLSDIDRAEACSHDCYRVNTWMPAEFAAQCEMLGIPFVTFSCHMVFGGESSQAFFETDAVCPVNTYGRSKAEMEHRVFEAHAEALVIRPGPLFVPWDGRNYLTEILTRLHYGEPAAVPHDLVVSPVFVIDAANAALDLLIDGEHGIWHLSHGEPTSWAQFVRGAAEAFGISGVVEDRPAADFKFLAPRPQSSALASSRGWIMPGFDDALRRYARDARETIEQAAAARQEK
jgi:dTDP-4-dehydrorhamnose reductase